VRIRPALALAAAVLSAAALSASTLTAPSAASTSPASALAKHKPRGMEWRPGAKLPKVPKGYKLVAWPPPPVLKKLRSGETVPVVKVKLDLSRRQEIRRYGHLENSAGIVNLELEPDVKAGAEAESLGAPKGFGCVPGLPKFEKRVGAVPTTVMQSYSTISHMTQKFTYGNAQSTSFSLGFSATGSDGTFGISGDASVSTYGSQDFTPELDRSFNHWQTYFEWGLYFVDNSCSQLDYYEDMPFQWNSGSNYYHPASAPKATFCSPFHAKDKFHKFTSQASTIKGAFDALGFKGSAQTGYTHTAEISFIFSWPRGTPRLQLCGTVNDPGADPGVIVASRKA